MEIFSMCNGVAEHFGPKSHQNQVYAPKLSFGDFIRQLFVDRKMTKKKNKHQINNNTQLKRQNLNRWTAVKLQWRADSFKFIRNNCVFVV